jgi:hypothetical protein
LLDLSSLDECRNEADENARLFKEKVKRWHDRRILKREFNVGEKILKREGNYSQNGKDLLLLKGCIVLVQ